MFPVLSAHQKWPELKTPCCLRCKRQPIILLLSEGRMSEQGAGNKSDRRPTIVPIVSGRIENRFDRLKDGASGLPPAKTRSAPTFFSAICVAATVAFYLNQ
jgi:hypothetical protein